MHYGKELSELIPMLKKYLVSLTWKHADPETNDEIFSESIVRTADAMAGKRALRNPENMIFITFRNSALQTIRENKKYAELVKEYKETKKVKALKGKNAESIIRKIDQRFSDGLEGEVWRCLKTNNGNCTQTSQDLGISQQLVSYYKKKINNYYQKIG